MNIRKIDEELIIIAGVVILGIVIVLGLATQTFKFSDGISAISVVIAAVALYYAKRVRGPEFTVAEARSTQRTEELTHITVLIQNIGDRMGYVRWETIYLKVRERIVSPDKKAYMVYKDIFSPDTQKEAGFSFPVGEKEDLRDGFFIANGVFSSHKGKLTEKVWETPLTGILKPIEGG